MNIDDVNQKIETPEEPIIAIFKLQKKLMEKYHDIELKNGINYPDEPWNLDDKAVQYIIKDMFWRVTEELAEAVETIPPLSQLSEWRKFWNTEVSVRHFFEELSDALHFLVEASIITGLNPKIEVRIHFKPPTAFNVNDDSGVRKHVAEIIFNMGLAANVFKNKPWKQTQISTDVQKFKNKLIDVWVDFITLWQKLGCSQEDIYILYVKKHDVNVWRQNTNY